MDSNNKYGPFDRQTLLKYLKGELSAEESWKVEKAMQDDPFLAEAMEGLASAGSSGEINEDLNWLQWRISKRKRHKILSFELPSLLNIAAVLLILVVSTWLVIIFTQDKAPSNTEIALKNQPVEKDSITSGDFTDAGVKKSQERPMPVSPAGEKNKVQENIAGKKQDPIGENQTIPLHVEDTKSGEDEKPAVSDLVESEPDKISGIESAAKRAEGSKDISITTEKEKQDDIDISSGAAGKSITSGELKERNKNKNMKREMNQSAGVSVLHYAEPYPLPGDSLYRTYILKNLRYPDEARTNHIQGDVVLQFMVLNDSTIENIIIVSGPGSGCNEEAVRLIREGPKWCPAISNGIPVNTRVFYTVPFQLKN